MVHLLSYYGWHLQHQSHIIIMHYHMDGICNALCINVDIVMLGIINLAH